MRYAILYASHHGTTRKVAEQLADTFGREKTSIINLEKQNEVDLTPFETVIIGGSIHAGQIQKKIRGYCEKNTTDLLKKRLGLFICSMSIDKEDQDFKNAYPEVLRGHAIASGCFGGELLFEKMNFFEKWIVKSMSGKKENVYNLHQEAITAFEKKIMA